jgi:energy-coupling factor transporter ATP-binding protein EcfA2
MHEERSTRENPFSTRRIRPGAVAYCFPAGTAVEDLLQRLSRNRWRGEIIGPHGSGKSALLAALLPALEKAGSHPVLFELHDGQRRLPSGWRRKTESSSLSAPVIVVVDGYEQLSFWSRYCLKRYCRRHRLGLLISSHVSMGLPSVFKTSCSLEMAQQIVENIMQNEEKKISPQIIGDLYARHGGNMREVLFDLYDVVEQQKYEKHGDRSDFPGAMRSMVGENGAALF